MFEFEFDQTLFEFAYARPQFEPLFELPPNSHSLYTFTPTIGGMDFFFCSGDNPLRGIEPHRGLYGFTLPRHFVILSFEIPFVSHYSFTLFMMRPTLPTLKVIPY